MSRGTRTLACRAAGLSGVGSSVLPLHGASVAVAADENAYRFTIAAGPHDFALHMAQIVAWRAESDPDAPPKYLIVKDHGVQPSDAKRLRFALGLATIVGGARSPNDSSDFDLFYPAEMTRGGVRGYLGRPVAAALRSGSAFYRAFEHGTVYVNMGGSATTIAGVTILPADVFVVP